MNAYRKNPDYQRHRNYKHLYGTTLDEYNQMLSDQGHVCAICKKSKRYNLCVDHDHTTKVIRGLLCHGCNRNLGFVDRHLEPIKQYMPDW